MANTTGKKWGGRQKGSRNKTTKALKEMILEALDEKGGIAYLVEQADENPTAFLTLIGKVLPLQIAGDPDNPLEMKLSLSEQDKALLARHGIK